MSDTTPPPASPVRMEPISLVRSGSTRALLRTPVTDGYVFLVLGVLFGAAITQRPEALALAAPFLLALAFGLSLFRHDELTVELHVESARVIEGDEFELAVTVAGQEAQPRLDVEVRMGDGLAVVGSDAAAPSASGRLLSQVGPSGRTTVSFPIRAEQWGVSGVEQVQIRVTDRFGFFTSSWEFRGRDPIRVALPDRRLRDPLEADRFRRIVGSHLSNGRGEGLEMADVRPFQPGDSMRDLNWRISNRRQEPWVTLRHPDRSATVILIVDADDNRTVVEQPQTDTPDGPSTAAISTTARQSVSGALALANTHLSLQDRVGLAVVGRRQEWIPPKLGRDQMHRIADTLVTVGNATGRSMRIYNAAAFRSIPTNAIVVVLSPLTDPLVVSLIADMRSRGHPVSVLQPIIEDEVSTTGGFRNWWAGRRSPEYTEEAKRLTAIAREIGIRQLRSRQVTIVPWPADVPVETALEALGRLGRSTQRSVSV